MFLEFHSKSRNDSTKSNVAIYLTKNATKNLNGKCFDLNRMVLEEKPLIEFKHIISYDVNNHSIEINNDLRKILLAIDYPSTGLPFVIKVNSKPAFGGYFWPSHSSRSCNTIAVDPFDLYFSNKLQFKLGYPGIDNFSGSDPRDNRILLNTFKQGGKLKRRNQLTEI